MAHETSVFWAGIEALNKFVYEQSGFSATVLDSFDVSGFEASPEGISWDGVDIYMAGVGSRALFQFSGFSSTQKSSFGATSIANGIGYDDADDVFICDEGVNKLFNHSGFTAAVKSSFSIAGVDNSPEGITSMVGAYVPWVGKQADKYYVNSLFTTTLITSADISGADNIPSGASATGVHGMFVGQQNAMLYEMSGFTNTITDTQDVSGINTVPAGISWGNALTRTLGPQVVQVTQPQIHIGDPIWEPSSTEIISPVLIDSARRYSSFRGRFRVFGTAVHRFYYDTSPIDEDTAVDETNTTLDGYTSTATFGNGTHYVGATKYNGLLDSGLGDVGANSEPYRTLRISASAAASLVPYGPLDWRLEVRASGVIRIIAIYHQKDVSVTDGSSDARAGYWAIAYTTDGSAPATDTPDETQAFIGDQIEGLSYDLPGQSNGTTVKVRLQTRRNDGTAGSPVWVYSASSSVLTATADASGPSAPPGGDTWAGNIPKET